jgi:basic membrane protein A
VKAKKVIFLGMVLLSFVFFSCGRNETVSPSHRGDILRVAVYVAGFQGDKAVIDSACNGGKVLQEAFPGTVECRIVEGSFDTSKWDPGLRELAEASPAYDLIFAGPFDLVEDLQTVALDYPDQKFVAFDASVDYSLEPFENVYSIEFYQNQSSYLAGAAAAMVAQNMGSQTIGVVAGMDIPPLNDFVVPYILGARTISPDIKVITSYVGNFEDSAKGKELALAQYNQGASVIFGPAGQAALGLFEASVEQNKYSLGCDGDQAVLFAKDGRMDIAKHMVTSAEKRVDRAILLTVEQFKAGTVPWGKTDVLGLSEDCVRISDNEYFRAILQESQVAELEKIRDGIIRGAVEVPSAFGLTAEEVALIRERAQP